MTKKNTNLSKLSRSHVVIVAVATAAIVFVGAKAIANSKSYQHLKLAADDTSVSSHFQKTGWSHRDRGRGFGHFAEMSDAEIEEKITRLVKHVSIEIDATPEQEVKISALIAAVAKDMKPMHQKIHDARKKIHELLLEDAIDRDALEKLRSERLAEIDDMSKNITTALADVAEVLTVEQRQTLDKRINEFRKKHRRGKH